MRQQEVSHSLVSVDLIFNPRESVTFIFVNLVINRSTVLLNGIDHLLRF